MIWRKRENNLKSDIFEKELAFIKNDNIREFAIQAIESLPDYFFVIPASSTGQYHPAYTQGDGGLVRHVRAAMRIAIELFRINWLNFTDDEKDLIFVAILLHDGWKNGSVYEQGGEIKFSKYSVFDHPLVASEELKKLFSDSGLITNEELEYIRKGIETHMGQWNTDYRSNKPKLEEPTKQYQKFIHLCDYLASRKCLIMDFDVELSQK